MLGKQPHTNKCVRNVASLQYRLYVILCVMLIKWLGCEKLKYMGNCQEPLEQKRSLCQSKQKLINRFSDGTWQEHPTNFFTKILRLKQKTKRMLANELIYLKYITLQSFKIAWKLCIKQISFGRVWTQLDVFGRDFRSLSNCGYSRYVVFETDKNRQFTA